jgi:F420-dependent oxidoreductase-like protein
MLLGLQIPSFTWPGAPASIGPTFRRIARDADQAGLDSLWVMDHFFQIRGVGPPEHPMLEGYTALANAAAVTERIGLGTMVTGVTYRFPGILVKTVTTLDVLSGGRAWLGIGAAWNEQEHVGLGVPFPPLAERFERLEETLRIAHQMFAGDQAPFEGAHYRLERPLNSPPALAAAHPRVLVGGSGERKTLRLVAQHADACNIFESPELAHKLEVLQQHCTDVGRDYAEIHRTTLGTLALTRDGSGRSLTPAQALERFGTLAGLGVDQAIVNMPAVQDTSFELLAELVDGLSKITPAGR